DLRQAAAKESASGFLGVAESLFIFMQQHNMKEENVLYPMMDQQLSCNGLSDAYDIRKSDTCTA
ncbi:MAG TPA: hypothetical protein VFY78_12600, partial [Gammaproteobacteria bacterium]|nr:hypothetical protein [Gammaproteobacteria bacterium]